jgi:hypothetical protein
MREDNPSVDEPGYGGGGGGAAGQPDTPSWLPPGAVLNADGSVTMPNGTVVPGPPPGYSRDPQTGVIKYDGGLINGGPTGTTPPMVPGIDPAHPQTDPTDPNVNINPILGSTYAPGTGGTPATPVTDPGTVGGGGGGGGGTTTRAPNDPGIVGPSSSGGIFGTNIGDFTKPFTEIFNAPTPEGIPDAPVFKAPDYTPPPAFSAPSYTPPPAFSAPTAEQAALDPGYQFTLGQGLGALLNSRAAGGMLNSGATGKALINYGQAAGATQYGNVYNRAADIYNTNVKTQYQDPYQQEFTKAITDYNTNYKTQYLDPYQNAFQNAQSEFAPKLTAWQTRAPMIQSQNNQNYQDAYNKWLSDYNMFTNDQDRAFSKFNTVLGS